MFVEHNFHIRCNFCQKSNNLFKTLENVNSKKTQSRSDFDCDWFNSSNAVEKFNKQDIMEAYILYSR